MIGALSISAMWCNISNQSSPGHFLYAGSDVDVALLKLIEPHELKITFIDPLQYYKDVDHFKNLGLNLSETSLHMRLTQNGNLKMRQLRELLSSRIVNVLGGRILMSRILTRTRLQMVCTIHGILRTFNFHMREMHEEDYLYQDITTFTHIGFVQRNKHVQRIFNRSLRYIQTDVLLSSTSVVPKNTVMYHLKKAHEPIRTHRLAGTPQIVSSCFHPANH